MSYSAVHMEKNDLDFILVKTVLSRRPGSKIKMEDS